MSKTVLITGCSDGGLGAAMAKVYHAKGFSVFATVRNNTKAKSLIEINGIEILDLEVTSIESIRKCAAIVAKHTGGKLDILVNNAGVNAIAPLLDAAIEDAKKVYDANLWSILEMAQVFSHMLIAAKGTICNISSVSGEMVFAWAAALEVRRSEFLRHCAWKWPPLGVRVVTVILGGVETSGNNPTNIADLELPSDSHYQKIASVIDRHKKTQVHTNKQNIDIAAKNVVEDVLGGHGPFIRRGQASTLSWICNTFLPYGLFTNMINKDSALDQV
ncbi:uncharacterized protein N7469_000460 [Penicillium citrinum]|uniref:Uncharacterized protein n=1 Tax=Penicillium citrinum TaxID=5077 RepID=A0A9W9PD36_PENCI|nr:uncharacterized protein N7469_000460 [Penicillium citrinum]KAJ5242133.1 hypothetical protein N7469_000460 [Penicillium citrinum]